MDKITIHNPKNIELPHPPVAYNELSCEVSDLSEVSDGYHTIAELYEHRITLYIALCRMIVSRDQIKNRESQGVYNTVAGGTWTDVWRSKTHSDGKPAYEGWFIMGISKEKGTQISYHLPSSRWDETDFAETLDRAPEWDGHTSNDVLERLKAL